MNAPTRWREALLSPLATHPPPSHQPLPTATTRSLPAAAWGALLARRLSQRGVLVFCLDYRNFPQVECLLWVLLWVGGWFG